MEQIDLLWINTGVSFLSILVAALLAYYFSQRRYMFEKLYDRKLGYLEELYAQIISLERDIKKYVYYVGANNNETTLSERKNELKLVEGKFKELREYFRTKEIVLNDNSIRVIELFIEISERILAELISSNISLLIKDPVTAHNQWNNARKAIISELEKAKIEVKKDFQNTAKY